jgi:hypothetical protein
MIPEEPRAESSAEPRCGSLERGERSGAARSTALTDAIPDHESVLAREAELRSAAERSSLGERS